MICILSISLCDGTSRVAPPNSSSGWPMFSLNCVSSTAGELFQPTAFLQKPNQSNRCPVWALPQGILFFNQHQGVGEGLANIHDEEEEDAISTDPVFCVIFSSFHGDKHPIQNFN